MEDKMAQQVGGFLEKLEKVDPEFHKAFNEIRGGENKGVLDPKTRALISLGIHMALAQGVGKVGADRARSLGATDDEMKETLRLAFLIRGAAVINAGLAAF
jgi:alkylhydroperoxidase/carboxymuconolactone decarboxylase family protein YurZ